MSTPLRAGLALIITATSLGTLAACNVDGPKLSDADLIDRKRDGALAVFVNRKVTDSLDVPDGDAIDWKYVDIPRAGRMQAAVAFDNPERIEGEVVLRDNFGTIIERQALNGGRNFYAFEEINAVTGRYYIQLLADSGASDYTVGVAFDDPNFVASALPAAPVPRGTDDGGGRRIGPGKTGSPPIGGGPLPDRKEGETPTDTVEKPDEPATPSTAAVSGSIRRITPIDGGGSMLTVYVSGSASDKVVAGTAGTINGLGARVVVRGRNGRFARAYTKVDSEDLAPYKAVTFAVKP